MAEWFRNMILLYYTCLPPSFSSILQCKLLRLGFHFLDSGSPFISFQSCSWRLSSSKLGKHRAHFISFPSLSTHFLFLLGPNSWKLHHFFILFGILVITWESKSSSHYAILGGSRSHFLNKNDFIYKSL